MIRRDKRSEVELTKIIMDEIGRHPEWSHITGVRIRRVEPGASHHSNWSFNWTWRGGALAPAEADEMVRELQSKFDLV